MCKRPFRILQLTAASALLLLAFAAPSVAQTAPTTRDGAPRRRAAGGLLSRLNLTPGQRAQIREIRRETEQAARPLLLRLRQARRALDESIYSDTADDALVQQRLREFTSAQAEAARLRATTELRIRRVLSPEQLATLRELRRQAQLQRRRDRRLQRRRPDALPHPDDPDGDPDASLERRRRP